MISTIREHTGAGLVAAAVIFASFAEGLFEPTGYAAASIVIWAALLAGLVGRALPMVAVGRTAAVTGIWLGATALLATASIAWVGDQGRAFEEAVRISFYLGLFVLCVCTASSAGRIQWLTGLTVGLAVVSVVALFAYLQPGVLDSGHSDVSNAVGRLSYPIGYWNGAAALLATAAVLLAHSAARAPSRPLRTVSTAVIPLAVLGIYLASSRGGEVALAIGLAVLLAASPDRPRQLVALLVGIVGAGALIAAATQLDALTSGTIDSGMRSDGDRMTAIAVLGVTLTGAIAWLSDGWSPRVRISRRVGLALALAVVIGLVVVAIAVDPAQKFRDFSSAPPTQAGIPVNAPGLSSNGRWQFWGAALDAFANNPIGGVGAGGYQDWWAQHASVPLFVRNAHSLPLQQAAELGLLGIALFLGFVGAVAFSARRRLAAGRAGDAGILLAVLAAGAVGAAVDWTWEIPAVFGPAVACSALLVASPPAGRQLRHGYWLGLATVSAAWVAMVAGGLVVLTERELTQSREAAAAGRLGDAMARARAARTVQPWSSEPYTQLALLEEEHGDLPQALSYLKQAEERDSDDWRLLLIEARLQARSGDIPAAATDLRRAQSLSPISIASAIASGNQ